MKKGIRDREVVWRNEWKRLLNTIYVDMGNKLDMI